MPELIEEPWPDPVDGTALAAEVLDRIKGMIERPLAARAAQ